MEFFPHDVGPSLALQLSSPSGYAPVHFESSPIDLAGFGKGLEIPDVIEIWDYSGNRFRETSPVRASLLW
jgi:hypothetical protein